MASQNDNPYKRFKKAHKGGKLTGEQVHAYAKRKASAPVKTSGSFGGKSNALGQGGRASQLKARGVPGGVIGNLARAAQAAPGQKNFHKKGKKRKSAAPVAPKGNDLGMAMKRKKGTPTVNMGGKNPEKKRKAVKMVKDTDNDSMKRKNLKKKSSGTFTVNRGQSVIGAPKATRTQTYRNPSWVTNGPKPTTSIPKLPGASTAIAAPTTPTKKRKSVKKKSASR